MSQYFAQISDPHLTSLDGARVRDLMNKRLLGYISWRRKRRHEHRSEVLKALQRDLQDQQFEQLLVTGDLTHIGLPEEFAQAAQWLQELGCASDVAVVPGNHDACVAQDPSKGLDQWRDYLASDSPTASAFPSLRIRGAIAFIGLSSACPTPPFMATGTLGTAQLERLAEVLAETAKAGLFRVIYLHHPPIHGQEKWRKRLTDAQALCQVLAARGADLILHGHGHRAHRHTVEGASGTIPVIAIPSASALGLHGKDSAQYNLYRLCEDDAGWRVDVEVRSYQHSQDTFSRSDSFTLQLGR